MPFDLLLPEVLVRGGSIGRRLTLRWPAKKPHPGAHFWANQVLSGLRANGVRVVFEETSQEPGVIAQVRFDNAVGTYTIAFDNDDLPEISEALAEESLVYFKTQYADGGYGRPNIVPGGYYLANVNAYPVLPLVRSIRRLRRFRYDVYGRFGLRYGGVEIRRRAHELLSERTDFTHVVSLFKYPGGPEKVPYRRYLFEISRAKVCVDMPGAGELTNRLVDYLAVGACVVRPEPTVRLPINLVDGEHVVYCARDLSDLGDVCAQLVRDDEERERIARNARDYFDRYLHRDRLGAYYVREITAAAERELDPVIRRRRRLARRTVRTIAAASLTGLLLLDVFIVIPEKLGDRPYNAIGHDTRPHHSQGLSRAERG